MTAPNHQLGYGDYLRFRDLVLTRSGLYFPERKRADLEIGLFKALQDAPTGICDLDAYYHFLCQTDNPAADAEVDRLLNQLTVGETHFFRDSAQFDALADTVLPALLAAKRAAAAAVGPNPPSKPQLRIWCAGCATGEEAYSLAILLYELLPDIQDWNIFLLATDINQESLARAQEALYTNWSFREPRSLTTRSIYFKRVGSRFQLRDDVRLMVTFARHNLIEDEFPAVHNNTASMDLILCRNVTIYFTEEITRRLVARFYDTLLEGGWLVVGHSEPSLLTYRAFQAHTFPGTLLYQRSGEPTTWPEDWEALRSGKNGQTPLADRLPYKEVVPAESPLTMDQATNPFFLSLATVPAEVEPVIQTPSPSNNHTLFSSGQPGLDWGKTSEEVAALLEEHVGEVPNALRASAYCYLARAYADRGCAVEARHWCQQAIKQDKLSTEAYYVLAMVNEHEGDLEQAIANLKKVVYLNREKPLAYFNLALLHKRCGQTAQARRALNNTIRILEKWPPHVVIPDSGGSIAKRLLNTARELLADLKPE
ncbi:MAG: hypothetical protein L0332_25190 [Chloroflexi bacterium]|nr:hypothetical protein [Chloroflexota bacterium]MCI0575186.1 hypothetical protein [Chloroflexota bacterium]MCI0647132.1 hypothetical protein [Chloroflexota bacterium]MCI0729992.1 hypothetical protein [Chloroflexota bacterium]